MEFRLRGCVVLVVVVFVFFSPTEQLAILIGLICGFFSVFSRVSFLYQGRFLASYVGELEGEFTRKQSMGVLFRVN